MPPRLGAMSSIIRLIMLISQAITLILNLCQLSFSIEDLFSTRIATFCHIPKTAQKEIASLKVAVWNDVLRDPEKPQRLDSRTCAHQINPLSAAWEEKFPTEIQSCGGKNQSL